MNWDILDTGESSAEENMRIDAELLSRVGSQKRPILHLYDWKGDCGTYGHFIDPGKFIDLERAKRRGLQLARRPTGGGIIFHVWDLAFSVLMPASCSFFSRNTLGNYAFVNGAVLKAVKEFLKNKNLEIIEDDAPSLDENCQNFCMAKPTKYDVMLQGKKIAGAAQRQTKDGYLHQGSIALAMPPEEYLNDILIPGTKVGEATRSYTYPSGCLCIKTAREELKLLLQKVFHEKDSDSADERRELS